jgi:uncharacterized protein YlxW (UPF0749 family)
MLYQDFAMTVSDTAFWTVTISAVTALGGALLAVHKASQLRLKKQDEKIESNTQKIEALIAVNADKTAQVEILESDIESCNYPQCEVLKRYQRRLKQPPQAPTPYSIPLPQ